MSMEEEFEEFYKDYLANEACEKNEVHYCSMCDNRRTRFKDKLFNVLR